jgi:deoxycytidine triphosphate deaminase
MFFLKSDELRNHIQSIIHKDTQQHETHFDLTVDKVHRFTKAGSLDFGGSEFKEAEKELLKPQKSQGDDYGWWNLPQGYYQATMNESVKEVEDTIAFITLHHHAQKAGVIANTTMVAEQNAGDAITLNFFAPSSGCNIKENARFAVLYLLAS